MGYDTLCVMAQFYSVTVSQCHSTGSVCVHWSNAPQSVGS